MGCRDGCARRGGLPSALVVAIAALGAGEVKLGIGGSRGILVFAAVEQADLVCTAVEVGPREALEATEFADLTGRSYPGRVVRTKVQVDRVIRGRELARQIAVSFLVPDDARLTSRAFDLPPAKGRALLALHKAHDGQYSLAAQGAVVRVADTKPSVEGGEAAGEHGSAEHADERMKRLFDAELAAALRSGVPGVAARIMLFVGRWKWLFPLVETALSELATGKDPFLQEMALGCLIQRQKIGAVGLGAQFLETHDPERFGGMIRAAIYADAGHTLLPELLRVRDARDAKMRRFVMHALRRMARPECAAAFGEALWAEDLAVRYDAMWGLAQLSGRRGPTALTYFLEKPEPATKEWRDWWLGEGSKTYPTVDKAIEALERERANSSSKPSPADQHPGKQAD